MTGAERVRRHKLRKAAKCYEDYLRSGWKMVWGGPDPKLLAEFMSGFPNAQTGRKLAEKFR